MKDPAQTSVQEVAGGVSEEVSAEFGEEFGLVEGPLGHLEGQALDEVFYNAALWESAPWDGALLRAGEFSLLSMCPH